MEDSKKQEPPQVGKDTLEESDSKFVEGLVESNTIPKYLRGPLSSVIKSRRDMVKAISNPVKQEVRAFGDELEKTDIPLGQKADIQTGTSGSYNRHRSLTMELVETDIESLQTSGVDILVERIGTEKSDDLSRTDFIKLLSETRSDLKKVSEIARNRVPLFPEQVMEKLIES